MKKLLLLFFLFSPFSSSFAQYMIYGVTGEAYDANNQLQYGTIFKYNPATHQQTVVFQFNDTDGVTDGRLFYASDSLLYGLGFGGSKNMGTLYSFNPKTNVETVLVNMDSTNGYAGDGGNELIEGKDGLLYGTTFFGGKHGDGVLFSYNMQSHKDSIRCNFNDSTSGSGGGPYMELWQDTTTDVLYGVSPRGGYPGGGGVIYSLNLINNQLTRYFVGTIANTNPWQFTGGLVQANNGLLYGMSEGGGSQLYFGTIYSFDIHSGLVQTACSFWGASGENPNGNELIQCSNGLLYGGVRQGGDITGDGVLFSLNPLNNTEKVLKTFHDTDGSEPFGRLIQDPDNGLLYGITVYGGDSGYGVLFSYDTGTGVYTKLLDFNGSNGITPAGLTLVKDTSVHVIKDTSGLGVNEVKGKSGKVKVYPNPNRGIFTVFCHSESSEESLPIIEIYNVLGEQVFTETLRSAQPARMNGSGGGDNLIDLSSQPDGVYLIRVLSADGSLIDQKKVMKVQ